MSDSIMINVDQSFYYSNKSQVPIKEVAAALLAAEKMYLELKPTLQALFPECDIKDITVDLTSLASGSITEDLVINIFFGGKDGYEKFLETIRLLRGKILSNQPLDDEDKKMIKIVMGLIVAAGIGAAVHWAVSSSETPANNSNVNTYNTTITNVQIGEGDHKLTGKQIVDIVETVSDKKAMAQAAVTLVKPAKNDPEATITFNGQADTAVPAAVVKETPTKFTKPMPEKKSEHYTNTPVFIVASDAQKRGTGWACIVPGIEDTRIALKLSDDVEPDKLHSAARNVVADIEVVKRFDKDTNSYKTTEVIVSKWEVAP